MKLLFAIIYLLIVACDIAVVRRMAVIGCSRWRKTAFALYAAVTDLLPVAALILSYSVADNTPPVLRCAMWLFSAYLITVLPRVVFYPFAFISQKRIFTAIGCIASLIVACCLIYGLIVGRKHIVITNISICSDQLPDSFDGFRIVHFSDLHVGSLLSPLRETDRVVDAVNSLDADLVVFSGDLVTVRYTELDDSIMETLSRLSAKYGVVASVGNHDTGLYVKDSLSLPKMENRCRLIDRERKMGWNVLDDTTIYLHRGEDSISVSGISFPDELYDFRHLTEMPVYDISHIYAGVPHRTFNVTVSHIPQMWTRIMSLGYGDLTLSGHVHAMQAKLHMCGRDFSPAELFYKQWSGLYEHDNRHLYINDGIGYVGAFMRIGAWPEITVLTLKSCKTEHKPSKQTEKSSKTPHQGAN